MDGRLDQNHYSTCNAAKDGWAQYVTINKSYDSGSFTNILASFAWKTDFLNVMFMSDYMTSCEVEPYDQRDNEKELDGRHEIVSILDRSSSVDLVKLIKTIHERQLHQLDDYYEIMNILNEMTGGYMSEDQRVQCWIIRQNIVDYWRGSESIATQFRLRIRRLNTVSFIGSDVEE